MKETSERLKEVLNFLKLTNNAFAREIGVSSTVINGIVSGSHNPGPKVLNAINLRFPNVNTDWLSNGVGQMLRSDLHNKPLETATFGDQVVERLMEEFAKLREQLSVKDRQIEGLQRTVDALISRPVTPAGNFLKPAINTGKIIPMPISKKIALNVA